MAEPAVSIDADIPGGNIIVERIDGDDVYVRPDLRDTEGDWFYWHFRVRGGRGRRLRFHLTRPHTLTAAGPAVSNDAGATWRWLGAASMDDWSFSHRLEADDVRLSMAMPYTRNRLDAFLAGLASLADRQELSVDTLCHTRKGRPVPRLRLAGGGAPRRRVLLTARHHCCEMMADYALEGLLARATADDELGRYFADNVEILAAPIVDLDGVEDGDQGKNRRPRDHNRDYAGPPIHPETAAIRRWVRDDLDDRLDVAIDLHCPWIRGADHNERIYLVGSPEPSTWAAQRRFGELLEHVAAGPLPYRAANNLPFGQAWNVGVNEDEGMSCSRWMSRRKGVRLATSIELPYAVAEGAEVNQTSAAAFGADLAAALRLFLEDGRTSD